MKKILFKKILSDCLFFFTIFLICSSTVIWVFQAVNFLDIMVEDGRSYLVYLNYSLLNFPKIISKILPFALFFSFFYVITKYELSNELVIFWSIGVNKIQLINFFIRFSFLIMIIQIFFTAFFVPKSLEVSRLLIKNSNIDIFEGFIKPKKFNDTIQGLTIYADDEDDDGNLINLYLKKDMPDNAYQITYSKKGKFIITENDKILELTNGETINRINNKISKFNFQSSNFNLSNLDADVIRVNKTQETSTIVLLSCLNFLYDKKLKFLSHISLEKNTHNCSKKNLDNIFKELYKRFIIPFYIPSLILVSLLLIVKSKENINYLRYRIFIFFIGLNTIIFSEITLKLIQNNFSKNLFIVLLPIIIFSTTYLLISQKFKIKFNYTK